jgi:hypothetical protein
MSENRARFALPFGVGAPKDKPGAARTPFDKDDEADHLGARRRSAAGLEGKKTMVSSSQQFERIRKRKMTTSGKRNKRDRRRAGTPVFPVHPEGYDTNAADAKRSAK